MPTQPGLVIIAYNQEPYLGAAIESLPTPAKQKSNSSVGLTLPLALLELRVTTLES